MVVPTPLRSFTATPASSLSRLLEYGVHVHQDAGSIFHAGGSERFRFIGVLGGLIAWGFIGIFLGATLLAIGYTLLQSWLDQAASAAAE
jgi:hypothetical protein